MALGEIDAASAHRLRGVVVGEGEPRVAVAASSLARAIVSAKTTAELAERIAALEAAEGLGDA
jgi:broad specificity phosphatase PhoE